MSIAFNTVTPRGARRLRLGFTSAVGAGAFLDLTLYRVQSLDGAGPSPSVVAAYVVPNSPAFVEIALSSDLAVGGQYSVQAISVPELVGGGVTPTGSSLSFRMAGEASQAIEPQPGSQADEFFGVDLAWNGQDFVELASGDLDTVSGVACVQSDLVKRSLSDGLLWDAEFGAHPRKYVDGSPVVLPELRSRILQQLLKDDRVLKATVTLEPPDESQPSVAQFSVSAVLPGELPVTFSTPIRMS